MGRRIVWWEPRLTGEEYGLVKDVLDSNFLNDGDVTTRFEGELAALLGVRYAVAVTSGTTAIAMALAAVGVGRGDEVIVPDVTFIATANAVVLTGATPVLVDVDPATLNVDPAAVARAHTSRTKAVVPVHVSGRAADMASLMDWATRHGIAVVEDAAEGFVSRWRGRCLGTIGHTGCFSFSPNKIITTGQGGVVVTDDAAIHGRLRELKDHGRPVRGTGGDDIHQSLGFNFKLTNLQAAVGLGQLSQLKPRLERAKQIYRGYVDGLRGVRGISLPGFRVDDGESPQWVDALVERRDDLDRHLRSLDIHCRRFWFPIHTQAPYRLPDDRFPHSTAVAKKALWLPSAFTMSDDDVAIVCHAIGEFLG